MKTKTNLAVLVDFMGFSTANAQVGIGTTTPDASAALDVESTDKGFLPPRLTSAQRNAIASPVEGLTIYNTDNGCLETYNGCAEWISMCDGSFADSKCRDLTTTVVDVTNGTTNKTWMDRNLGASQAAASSTDANAYGDLYQWGRCADGHESRTSVTTATNATTAVPNASNSWDGLFITESTSPNDWLTPQDNTLWQGVSCTNNPCPAGYRLPTEAEWTAEKGSWSSQNLAGAFGSPLKIPAAGYRANGTGTLTDVGQGGSYWSSTVTGNNVRQLSLISGSATIIDNGRALGISVRCIKD